MKPPNRGISLRARVSGHFSTPATWSPRPNFCSQRIEQKGQSVDASCGDHPGAHGYPTDPPPRAGIPPNGWGILGNRLGLICCDALSSTHAEPAFTVFERAFKDFGLPKSIRTDNGTPFASASAIFGLTKLSVWWLRLGIGLERIQPGRPTQNGRHERMHLTLKKETTKPAANNFLQQQEKFDRFIDCYNQERPHQAIGMHYPAELYQRSAREYHGLNELEYPFHDRTVAVTMCGRVCFGSRKINLSTVFAGRTSG